MSHHRSDSFDRLVLPECMHLIQAIGHRMAYDATVSHNIDRCLIDLYVSSCIKLDPAWYGENAGLNRFKQRGMENTAVDAVFERLEEYLGRLDVEDYITAPLISEEKWKEYVDSLQTFGTIDAHESGASQNVSGSRAEP